MYYKNATSQGPFCGLTVINLDGVTITTRHRPTDPRTTRFRNRPHLDERFSQPDDPCGGWLTVGNHIMMGFVAMRDGDDIVMVYVKNHSHCGSDFPQPMGAA